MTSVSPAAQREDSRLLAEYASRPSARLLDQLVERYLPLSRSLARRYRGGNEPFEDLIQVADLGLVKAIQGFDPDRGLPFTAYAVPTILGELRRHFRDRVWNLRLPRGLQESTAKVGAAVDEMTEELSRSPTVAEIAGHTGLDAAHVHEALAAEEARYTVSLDAPSGGDEEGASIKDTLGSRERGYDLVEASFASASAGLEERELEVLMQRFVKGKTQREIADERGVSQMQISRTSRKALKKLLEAVSGDERPPLAPEPQGKPASRSTGS